MGTVYEVEDRLAGGAIRALKALWPGAAGDALVATLRSEFAVLARLRHPLLCQVHDFGRLPADAKLAGAPGQGGYFLTRDLLEGVDLGVAAEATGRDLGAICRLLAEAARGLEALHQAGLRHGDFKPGNVIAAGDRVRLIDFGLTAEESRGRAAGTLVYMAPEVLAGRPADRRADLYAVGVALCELATGRFPFEAGADVAGWHRGGVRPRLSDLGATSDAADELVRRCLAIDPDDRVASAAELAAGLDACADALGARPRAAAEVGAGAVPPMVSGAARTLERGFERRRNGRGGAAVLELVGDAGSGKSRALTELSWRAQIAGAEVVRAGAEHRGATLGAIGACLDQLAALSGAVVPTADDGGETGAFATAVARWLATLGERWPVVIVLDDLDQADAFSGELAGLLALVLPDAARVLIVASTRRAALGAEVVRIDPLSLGDVDGLLARAAGRRDLRLAARVHAHTGGNLSHVVFTLEALARRRFPPAESLDAVALPPSLDDALAESYRACDDRDRVLCEALAILGRPAAARLCAAIVERDAGDLGAVPGLIDRDGEVLRLSRPSLRTVVLRGLPAERRRALHRAAARALAGVAASSIEITMQRVRGGEVDDGDAIAAALEALWDAGDRPAALALGDAACRQRSGDRALAVRVGELAQLAGDRERAWRWLEPLAEDDDAIAARARLALARALDQAGDPDRAEALLAPLAAGGPVAAAAAQKLAQLCIRRGRFADALAVVDRALAAGHGADPQLVIAQAFARGILGRDSDAEAVLDEVAERAAAAGDRALAAAAWHYGARIAFSAGDYQSTRRRYQSALAAAEAVGDLARVGILRMNLAAMDFSFGDLASSKRHYEPALSHLRAAGADTYAVIARRNFGHLLLELGAHERARRELGDARTAAREVGLPVHDIGIGALLGVSAWRTGDLARGRDQLEEARRRFGELGDARRVSETTLDLVELELESGELDASRLDHAQALLAEVANLAATTEDTARRGRFLALSADLAARRGDEAIARRELDALGAVLGELERQGARQLEWDLRRVVGSTFERLGEGARAATERRAALAILEAMSRDLGEAERIAFWQDPRRRSLRAPSQTSSAMSILPSASAQEVERLYRLLAIYRQLSSERDVKRLLAQVMETAVELCRGERGFLLLADDRTGALRTAVAHNLPREGLLALERADADDSGDGERPYSRSIAERVFSTGEAVVSRDASVDPRFEEARSVHALHLESVVCVPVHAAGQVLGALYLEGLSRRSALGDDDLRLLMAFGDQVAILLENARLLAENQRRTAELDAARGEIEALLVERTELLDLRTAELAGARRDLAEVSRRFLGASGAFGIVGRSPAMEEVFERLDRLAATDVPVLVLGESGTGKELVARALHQNGSRQGAPLVTVNCGALPETLLESELFGHERGAFTGADRRRAGLFETADGGTLFLDEVGEAPPRMQAQLLRALQEKVIRRVGGTSDIAVDVRLVAATNRDLEELVARGEFREDLYYRLHVVPIVLPPLRDRDGDVALLVDHFLTRFAERSGGARRSITRRGLALLTEHRWPGNVRQLEHALTSAAVMADGEVLDVADLAPVLAASDGSRDAIEGPDDRRESERARILAALEGAGWNKSQAARDLGMPRRTFYRRLDEYDIQ